MVMYRITIKYAGANKGTIVIETRKRLDAAKKIMWKMVHAQLAEFGKLDRKAAWRCLRYVDEITSSTVARCFEIYETGLAASFERIK